MFNQSLKQKDAITPEVSLNLHAACSILSLQREQAVESESSALALQQGPIAVAADCPLSQEKLIRKAAGLSHFLLNEVAVASVSVVHADDYLLNVQSTPACFHPAAMPDYIPGVPRRYHPPHPIWRPLCRRGQFGEAHNSCRHGTLRPDASIVCQEDQEELSPSPTEEPWPKKFPEPLSWRSDEEDEDSDFGEEQRDRYLKVCFFFSPL